MPREPVLHYLDALGSFCLENPESCRYLYFPLVNEAGMIASVTPTLAGDAKTGQNTFLLPPASAEDLHESRFTRNFWARLREGAGVWSACGAGAGQAADRAEGRETSRVEAGFLWHRVIRENSRLGLRSEITSFVPDERDTAELMKVVLTNLSDRAVTLTPTAAVPIYARSADNIRSHRHVTSLLNRTETLPYGVRVTPTLLFDERGHSVCRTSYAVFGADAAGAPPVGFFPDLERFTGEGGALDWPRAVTENLSPPEHAGAVLSGWESLGGLRFADVTLQPGGRAAYLLALCIDPERIEQKYLTEEKFDAYLAKNRAAWEKKLTVRLRTASADFDRWMNWVGCEPILRRICGCSFLPYHDYGRGGRGWRDLWQDCIALLMTEPEKARGILYASCAGIRFDGTNATIVGSDGVSFLADRDRIVRVWMDHAAWPANTVVFYLEQSGDFDFLLKEQTYFRDARLFRCQKLDPAFDEAGGTLLTDRSGAVSRGTVLEHLLIENLTACLDVGEHGMLRLHNADWNDALDMAAERGESAAFSSMYCGNLRSLAALLEKLEERGHGSPVLLAEEVSLLLDGDDGSPEAMQERLGAFCESCAHGVSGRKKAHPPLRLAAVLREKAARLAERIVRQERVSSREGYTWLNGYYDNHGRPVEGETPAGVRMTLTGQVFAVMSGVADDSLTKEIVRAAKRYLFDAADGGYRLNTDFHEVKTDLGRQFGFAFGHKENGSVFSHMAVMFAYALYKRGFAAEGYRALKALCGQSMAVAKSRIYPGIPEYFNPRGRGMYPYLTGAASWLLMTLTTQAFGIRGEWGDLLFDPKLAAEQFGADGTACCELLFGGKRFRVVYRNPGRLDFGEFRVQSASLDGAPLEPPRIRAEALKTLDAGRLHTVDILLERTRSI